MCGTKFGGFGPKDTKIAVDSTVYVLELSEFGYGFIIYLAFFFVIMAANNCYNGFNIWSEVASSLAEKSLDKAVHSRLMEAFR